MCWEILGREAGSSPPTLSSAQGTLSVRVPDADSGTSSTPFRGSIKFPLFPKAAWGKILRPFKRRLTLIPVGLTAVSTGVQR
jgi:hypothetical protein